jgi:hypothetical protein
MEKTENTSQPEEKVDFKELLDTQIKNLESKNFSMYFFVMDTKGNPTAGIANIYKHVKTLKDLGYNAKILHEKNEYTSVKTWLGNEYSDLPHVSIEEQQLKVNSDDFVIIPEIFANVMEQTMNLPCKRIVLCQAYDYVLEMLMPGKKWSDYGINECITTSEKQSEHLKSLMGPSLNTNVIPISIPKFFKPSEKPKKPIIAIFTRDQRDTVKIFKTFYIKYPHLKWFTFRDMRNMPVEKFAENMAECCISVWVDDISGFGTFPLESMKCDVPVLGKVPNMVPEWMEDKNGLWTHEINVIPDILANYIQAWLEDASPEELYEKMGEMKDKYKEDTQKEKIQEVYKKIIDGKVLEVKSKLEKLEPVNNEN